MFENGFKKMFFMWIDYKDVLSFLKKMRFECKMPTFIENGERQLSTQKTNEARVAITIFLILHIDMNMIMRT